MDSFWGRKGTKRGRLLVGSDFYDLSDDYDGCLIGIRNVSLTNIIRMIKNKIDRVGYKDYFRYSYPGSWIIFNYYNTT